MSKTEKVSKPMKKLLVSSEAYAKVKARAHARGMTPADYVSSLISVVRDGTEKLE
jgi:hypothetical protein